MANSTTKKGTVSKSTKAVSTTKKTTPKTKTRNADMWTSISGDMYVYGKEFKHGKKSFMNYSTSVSKKTEDDEYINYYLNVRIVDENMDMGFEGKGKIRVDKGFLCVDVWNDGSEHLAVVVLEGEVLDIGGDLPF